MAKLQKIAPCLWFDGNGEEAARFYVSIFDDSAITALARYPEGSPGTPGSVMLVAFRLAGQEFLALNGGPMFTFSEAISFVVHCEDQAEIDRVWDRLTEDGGQPVQCGWLKDRFGLSWQVVPADIAAFYPPEDPDAAARVMQAVMGMVKLDIAAMTAARDGA
ncbi:VOC family protein [Methylobrevis pamukkalensis]